VSLSRPRSATSGTIRARPHKLLATRTLRLSMKGVKGFVPVPRAHFPTTNVATENCVLGTRVEMSRYSLLGGAPRTSSCYPARTHREPVASRVPGGISSLNHWQGRCPASESKRHNPVIRSAYPSASGSCLRALLDPQPRLTFLYQRRCAAAMGVLLEAPLTEHCPHIAV
jgi:hypothetical protein